MELWVRSQDKERLGKIVYLELRNDDYGFYIIGWRDKFEGTRMGTYKTKERALELLDEIQELIKPKQIITTYESEIKEGINKSTFDVVMTPKIDNIQLMEPTILVYQMPKD